MMRHARFHTITLGCKLNQFDGAAIEGELARRGLRPEADRGRAGVVVLNTCTVTHRADSEARRLARAIRRENPGCLLLVTGCYAELEAETLRAMPEIDRVFGNRDKPRLGAILDELGVRAPGEPSMPPGSFGDRGCEAAATLPDSLHFGERSRAFLKVQEGCRLACSYCVIPRVRGASRSVPVTRLVAAARALARRGYREIVLTGVNTGDYGRDLEPRTDLASLLDALLEGCGATRFRLNSLEPLTVSGAIVERLAREPRLAKHLQVPLQSGSDGVLQRMRRNYRAATYLERLRALRAACPEIGLGADVIVGFPGETEAEFGETLALVESSPLNYLHVFSWSPRPGTPAAELVGRVSPAVVRDRSRRLRELGETLALEFRRGFVGRTLDAVVLGERRERRREPSDERRGGSGGRALSGNFIEVALPDGGGVPGDLVAVEVLAATPSETTARIVGRPAWAPRAAPQRPGPVATRG
jgi:threonylcarbamoyladenosine tRNA methylthiotransferase MtaB